ncbi:hypothetical protein NDA11_006559 [Ustilago hordei]|nr:hypothetical protein NDA11_006559 [Ustilago hordei]
MPPSTQDENYSASPPPQPSSARTIAGDRILTDSRAGNISTINGKAASQPTTDSSSSADKTHTQTPSTLTHKRSVKSITKEYEVRKDNTTTTFLRPPSASSRPSSPTYSPPQRPATVSSLDVPYTNHSSAPVLQKRNSFFLSSQSDPSTLTAPTPRARSLSNSSGAAFSRSPSIRLASGSYPSTLRPPVDKASNSSIRSLPQLPHASAIDTADKLFVSTSPTGCENSASPRVSVDEASKMSAPQDDTAAAHIGKDAGNRHHHHHEATAEDNAQDEALYEGMDSVADLSNSSTNSAASGLSSASIDFSKMTVAEKREHSRRHSNIHSRNLSVFFPQPGTEAEAESDAIKAREHFEQASTSTATSTSDSATKVHRRGNSGNRPQITVSTDATTLSPRSASFAALTANEHSQHMLNTPDNGLPDLSPSPMKSRRGHHHRHSVAMLDSALSPMNGHGMERSTSSTSYASNPSFGAGHGEGHTHGHGHGHRHTHRRSLHSRTVSALGHIPQASRPLLLFGISHFGLGAALWMAGQEVDSLSATGLGYLVVFDAMGILSSAISDWALEWEQHASDLRRRSGKAEGGTLRRPYGMHRVSTLLHFVQTIYLLFASVYVLKESVEHALLEGGSGVDATALEALTDSASGHDRSHAHAEHSVGIMMPNLLLALSLAACVFSNIVMGNHTRLVAACGISTAASGGAPGGPRHGRSGSVLMRPSELASPLLALLANPFSLTVLFFSSALLFAGLTMPSIQVAALDKVLAGLESVSMFYVAYPASVALGKVLLQTAPSDTSPDKEQLKRALKLVGQHPLVSYVPPPNLWQLTAPTSALVQADRAGASGMLSGGGGGGRGVHFGSKSASLVASVTVWLKQDASEEDCFEMTKWIWERLAPSVGAGRGLLAGEMLRGTQRAGELTVSVRREGHEGDGDEHFGCDHGHGDSHDHHDHGHGHGQSYGHHHHHH